MESHQIELLLQAAQRARLSPQQISSLQADNPYRFNGEVAQRLQTAVAEINPVQAREWASDAGVGLSLMSAAARAGLAEMTPQAQAEINRVAPMSHEEQRGQQLAQLTATNPYGEPERWEPTDQIGPDGQPMMRHVPKVEPNLTRALLLEQQFPEEAARLKSMAAPKESPKLTEREQSLFLQHGYGFTPQSQES